MCIFISRIVFFLSIINCRLLKTALYHRVCTLMNIFFCIWVVYCPETLDMSVVFNYLLISQLWTVAGYTFCTWTYWRDFLQFSVCGGVSREMFWVIKSHKYLSIELQAVSVEVCVHRWTWNVFFFSWYLLCSSLPIGRYASGYYFLNFVPQKSTQLHMLCCPVMWSYVSGGITTSRALGFTPFAGPLLPGFG